MWTEDCGLRNGRLPAAVIFDMDGVLADTEPLHGACFIQAFRRMGIEISFEDYRQAVTLGGSSVRDFYLRLGGDASTWDAVKAIKDDALQAALRRGIHLMPGVMDLLLALRRMGISTAVATSARRRSLELVLDRLNLWSYFGAFATKDEVDVEKPDPAVFLLAAVKLEAVPADCVVIEDAPRGVLAASRAGMKCVAVPTPSTADGDFSLATICVPSLSDVSIPFLQALFPQP